MILSVLRNTNSSVKFWFIENFLSPSFLVSKPAVDNRGETLTSYLVGIHPTSRWSVRVPVRTRDIQMAFLAPRAEREATYHLGLQNPIPWCFVSHGPQKGYFRRRWPNSPGGLARIGRPWSTWGTLRIYSNGWRQRRHGRFPILEDRLLEGFFARPTISHKVPSGTCFGHCAISLSYVFAVRYTSLTWSSSVKWVHEITDHDAGTDNALRLLLE
jgi:hypothetical protein